MSGEGAAPDDPEAMRAWLDGEPAFAFMGGGKLTIEPARAFAQPSKNRPAPVCYVVASPGEGHSLQRKLNPSGDAWPDVYVMWPGCSVIGRRFSTILVTRAANDMKSVGTPTEIKRTNRWFLEALQTRLTPDGVMIRL